MKHPDEFPITEEEFNQALTRRFELLGRVFEQEPDYDRYVRDWTAWKIRGADPDRFPSVFYKPMVMISN